MISIKICLRKNRQLNFTFFFVFLVIAVINNPNTTFDERIKDWLDIFKDTQR
jgi:hypothetical protein